MWASLKSFKLPSSLRNSNEAWTGIVGGSGESSHGIDGDGAENNKPSSVVSSSPVPPARRRTSSQLKSQTPLVSGSDHAVLVLDAQEASYEDWNRLLGSFQFQPSTTSSEEDDKERGSALRQEMAKLIWKGGIPDHLRGKVWNILARAEQSKELLELYPVLLKKETSSEVMDSISIDIMRTFPAHALFKDASGIGQDILLKISKAYSNYDEEVGYFQGLSFLAAALVLHLPEEEAFCLLVKMSYEYGLRGLYRNGMEVLKTRFYQFERYIEELMPDLHAHLSSQEIEMQMFASQWFLTVFCAKFSLSFAFRVLDLFFLEGMDAVLKVALCILRDNRKELLRLGFEDILHYLRIQIPKKYSEVQSIDGVFAAIAEMKLSHAKLLQFESEHKAKLAADAAAEAEAKAELSSVASSASAGETNQLEVLTARLAIADRQKKRLERENKRVSEQNARLEEETNSLARQLVERQVSLMQALERASEEKSALRKELLAVKESSSREKSRLQQELDQLRTLYRSALAEALEERSRLEQEKCELKALCRQLGQQHEQDKSSLQSENDELRSLIAILSANHSVLQPPDSASQKPDEETPPFPLACESFISESDSSTPTNSNTDSDSNKTNHVNGTTSFTPELLFRIRELADAGRRGDEQRRESDLANENRLRALEEQLALTKLQLAECECQRQELDLALKQAKGVDSSGKRLSLQQVPHTTSRPIGISSAGGGTSSLSFSPGSGSPNNALGKGWLLLKRNDPT